ncbi:MAG: bifunctional 5,10-methylenetetrahydrofolate dehydrogenase/5,10-methenyltetrahydrofolate cyclohydrolase, partial [Clostridia bacterium]|nr:bifunctional 5,10-methylenetetrahydrofolate dehydrogenase/5,10-methenyltetrahydrofolate cyclohydrolase [Clostridia bacterium]
MYKIIDGKELAAKMRIDLKKDVEAFSQKHGRHIGLAVVLAGDNPASQIYVKNKIRACEEVGIKSFAYYLSGDVSQEELENLLRTLAEDKKINGILVQLPLPEHLDSEKALKIIPDSKDVDGFSADNIGKLCQGKDSIVACTPNGVMKMLESCNVDLRGKKAVIVGRSNIVGKPMAMLLLNADATVTICHSKTRNLKEECLGADVLVAAIGRAKFITADMVKQGAVVV